MNSDSGSYTVRTVYKDPRTWSLHASLGAIVVYLDSEAGTETWLYLKGPEGTDWEPLAGMAGGDGMAGPPGADGQPGQDGSSGASILAGAGTPSAGLGAVGDLYIDTATGDLWKKS